jgi:protein tyrosine/serine phosphatase
MKIVKANVLYRGPRPNSFEELYKEGITRIISLQSGFENAVTESRYEHQQKKAWKGIRFYSLRWEPYLPPSRADIRAFLSFFKTPGHKTYVHCHAGVDRTGVAVMAYQDVLHELDI